MNCFIKRGSAPTFRDYFSNPEIMIGKSFGNTSYTCRVLRLKKNSSNTLVEVAFFHPYGDKVIVNTKTLPLASLECMSKLEELIEGVNAEAVIPTKFIPNC